MSFHQGGVFFGFADGSVHWLSDSTDSNLYMHLCLRDDGKAVPGF